MQRSSWKGIYINQQLINNFKKHISQNKSTKVFKILERNSTITLDFLNYKVGIYNGLKFINIFIDESKIGYKFGEFSYSRQKCIHKVLKKIKKK